MSSSNQINFQKINPDARIPQYATEGSAGFDFCSVLDYSLKPMERKLFPTGLKLEIPRGYELQIRPRSGLALKFGITVLNSPGTIDSDYRGEIGILLVNFGDKPYDVKKGERIAQGVLAPYTQATFREVSSLEETSRGTGGFGSTGTK